MIDNRNYLRLVENASNLTDEISLLCDDRGIALIRIDKENELGKTQESIHDERRKMRGQVHFLLDLIASDDNLKKKLRSILMSDLTE